MRSVRGVAAHESTWFPPITVDVLNFIQRDAIINPWLVDVSNFIQLDAIINPWLVKKRLLPCLGRVSDFLGDF